MLIQRQSHTIRPMTTAHLAQTMTLLELSGEELGQKVEAELSTNPALDLLDTHTCPTCHRYLTKPNACPVCNRAFEPIENQPIIFISPRSDFSPKHYTPSDNYKPHEDLVAEYEDLPTYVLRQIAPDLNPSDRDIAVHILTCLDNNGLLNVPITEIARYHHVPLSRVNSVLRQIQSSDPIGVGSPTPQEALLIQYEILSESNSVPPLVKRALEKGMDLLSRRSYVELGRLLGVSTSDAEQIAQFIGVNLNPFPARAHWGNIRRATSPQLVYSNPDVIISQLNHNSNSELVVEIVSPYAGLLRINPLFREALSQAPTEKSEKWHTDFDQGTLLIKCIQQRNNTLVRFMGRIVELQLEFILKGDAHLIPITRASLAKELGVHESTVSRTVSSKTVQLPNKRIIPLSLMFDRSLHIRAIVREIIEEETTPLNDSQIAELLAERGYSVARRTVAKYRSIEGILPARMRHATK